MLPLAYMHIRVGTHGTHIVGYRQDVSTSPCEAPVRPGVSPPVSTLEKSLVMKQNRYSHLKPWKPGESGNPLKGLKARVVSFRSKPVPIYWRTGRRMGATHWSA